MAGMSRNKGKRGEREAAALFREHGWAAHRGQQHSGSPDSPDIVVEGPHRLHVEVKRVERPRLEDALEQAQRDAGPDEAPIVLWKRNRGRWRAYLDAEVLLALLNGDLRAELPATPSRRFERDAALEAIDDDDDAWLD